MDQEENLNYDDRPDYTLDMCELVSGKMTFPLNSKAEMQRMRENNATTRPPVTDKQRTFDETPKKHPELDKDGDYTYEQHAAEIFARIICEEE